MRNKRRLFKKQGRLGDSNLLSRVQNPDDLEIAEIVKQPIQGSTTQLINEESPDDLEIYDEQKRS